MAIVSDLLQLCRLCLVKDEVNVPIFEGESDDQQISLKISSCLPVTLSQDDRLPQKICSECCRKLDTLYEFRNSSVNAEKQLVTWLEELENQSKKTSEKMSIATESLSEKTIVKEEIDEVDENGALSNEAEDYILQQQVAYDKTDLLNDAADETGEPQPKRAKRAAALKALIHTQESEEDEEDIDEPEPITKAEEESEPSETDINESVDDTFAGGPSTSADDQPGPSGVGKSTEGPVLLPNTFLILQPSSSPTSVPRYILVTEPGSKVSLPAEPLVSLKLLPKLEEPSSGFKPRPCRTCGELCFSRSDQRAHKKLHKGKEYLCPICGKAFVYLHELNVHKATHDQERKFKCEICGVAVKARSTLITHMKRHDENEYKFPCTECDKKFVSEWYCQKHIDDCHSKVRYVCDLCGKSFGNQGNLKGHMKIHFRTTKSTCDKCGKELANEVCLRHHIARIHDKSTLQICNICGKAISTTHSLNVHMRSHTGEKPYKCNICGKAFTKKPNLRMHTRTHTKERPYKCKECEKCFTQRGTLTLHIRQVHTGDLRYECVICQKKFVTLTLLKMHSKKHEGLPKK